ncbi:hypothetical protein Rsub_04491 [Raphidocelis subcapitata]|uniref:ABC transporter domain-containing protein n=1 Tax=Raphidocelis subcapitata TaxID=307507 RepID=A0A2V0NWY1_9CHLO|nr:hypothetical protein Rsub_04491 [Raphidocelis subcapitata]|eukprot:GBF92144.1 hypothetical protein Rsub_04491 [Raphidocelis subcapitata]
MRALPQQRPLRRAGAPAAARPWPRPAGARPGAAVAAAAVATAVAAPPAVANDMGVGDVPRGETAGAVALMEGITLQVGERDLLQEVDWKLMPGHRVGLVGANGAGKSTLLRAMAGLRTIQAGRLVVAPKVELGYLSQTAVSGSTRTVWEEARSQMHAMLRAEAAMEVASHAMAAGDVSAADDLASSQEAFEAAGGFDADRRIGGVLAGLGFSREQWHRSCTEFSGGWQMRIALARLLLSDAGQAASKGAASGGLMLMDEPTNHLDSAAVKWLAGFLSASGGTLVLVSHDEALLQGACDRIVEVRGKKLHHYVGNYERFIELRAERESQAAATAAATAAEIERLEGFVARFGAKASKASQAQSRQKQLEKLRDAAPEAPAASSGAGPGDARKVTLKLPTPPPCFTDVIELQGVAAGWGEPGEGRTPIVSGVNAVIQKGQRVLVLGPNGAGKSTLLKTVGGGLAPWEGRVKLGEGAKLGVFSQDLAQELPQDRVALEYVSERAREVDATITLEKCRQALGALGLTGSMAMQTIGSLSGGEKARVALAVFALVPANVLLLDEASNHLDAATIDVLTGALRDFAGTIIAITHNRAFAESLNATHVLRVSGGSAALSVNGGLRDADFDHAPPAAPVSSNGNGSGGNNGSGVGGSGAQGGAKGKGKGKKGGSKVKAAPAPAAAPAAAAAPARPAAAAVTAAAAAPKEAPRKRTTLSWAERTEYEKLCKSLEKGRSEQAVLEARVAAASADPSKRGELEAASAALGAAAARVEEMELRWLELAELAGDL